MTYLALPVRTVHRWRGRRFVVRRIVVAWNGKVVVRANGVVYFSATTADALNWNVNGGSECADNRG